MDGLVEFSDAEHAAFASLTDEEARKLFLEKDCIKAVKERVREIVAAQEAKKARESSSGDADVAQTSPREPRDERKSKWEALAKLMTVPSVARAITHRNRPRRDGSSEAKR
jgi:hypothetical protein